LARRRAGTATAEQFLTRAQTRAGIVTSLTLLDHRGAALAHGAAVPPHLAGCGGCLAPAVAPAVLWRDALALIRNPSRLVWAGFVCVGGT
jgi:hypothetical protein